MVTLLGLLQRLHSRLTFSCITISTPEEVKVGLKNCMSCCPICAYIVKNDYSFLNHIVIRHYWSSFSCGKCLKFAMSSGQQMRTHFGKCKGSQDECKKKKNFKCKASKVSSGDKSKESCHKSKAKKDKVEKEDKHGTKEKKLRSSPSKSVATTTSPEHS